MGWGYTKPRPPRAWSKPTHMGSDQFPFEWALTRLPLLRNHTVLTPPLGAWVGKCYQIRPSPHPAPSHFFIPGRSVIRVPVLEGIRTLPL